MKIKVDQLDANGQMPPPPSPDGLQVLIGKPALETLKREATTDPLTGLLNRRGFTQAVANIKKMIEEDVLYANQSTDTKKEFALLTLDIDFYKEFNDVYSYELGDAVLKEVSTFLSRRFRAEDIVGRLGGEEFGILLQGKSSGEFLQILNKRFSLEKNKELSTLNFPLAIIETTVGEKKTYRLRPNKETELLPNETLIEKTLSFSGGLVLFSPDKDDLAKKLDEANSGLKAAKRTGRDHIETPGFEEN